MEIIQQNIQLSVISKDSYQDFCPFVHLSLHFISLYSVAVKGISTLARYIPPKIQYLSPILIFSVISKDSYQDFCPFVHLSLHFISLYSVAVKGTSTLARYIHPK